MARYKNKGPVMNLRRGRNLQGTRNWATGERKELPYTVPTGGPNAGKRTPQSFEEANMEKEDFYEPASIYEQNRGIDPSSFDVSDPEQVLAFQRQAGLEEDAMFGPKTQEAWEKYVNRRRVSENKEQYDYGRKSLVDLVNERGKPDAGSIREQIKRNEEAGMYQDDIDTGDDEEYGLGDFFRNAWSKWTN